MAAWGAALALFYSRRKTNWSGDPPHDMIRKKGKEA
jgi:hypothetical protein